MTQFLLGIIEITLTMSAVIALLLLLSKLFGQRFTAKCRYLIWIIVVIRLCVPFGTVFLPSLVEVELPVEIILPDAEPTSVTPPANNRPENATAMQNTPETVTQTIETGTTEIQTTELPETPSPTFKMPSVVTILNICGCIWLAGAAAYLIVALARYNISMNGLHKTLQLTSAETDALYQKLCQKQNLRRAPALYVSAIVSSPMLCGYFKPRIILPDIELSPNSLVGILAHELTHYRRRDLWIKLLCVFAESLHWFNPLIHIAAKRCNCEMELSCDETVLAGLNEDARLSYGNVMLDIIKRCRRPSGTLTTQFNPKKSAVKERFNNILDMTKKKRGLWIIAGVAAVCVIAGTVIGCNVGGKKPPEPDITDADSEAILSYLENNTDDIAVGKNEGDIIAASYELLGSGSNGGKIYLYVNKESYHNRNDKAERTDGVLLPVVLYVERNNGELVITKHASPRDGKYYGGDMKKLFPTEIIALINETDSYKMQINARIRASEKLKLPANILIASADLDGDNANEEIMLEISNDISVNSALYVLDNVTEASNGIEIYREEAGSSHAMWNNLYLCTDGVKSYLLRYNPSMYQGFCSYSYELFTLDGKGGTVTAAGRTVEFDINGSELDIDELISFADEVNALLEKSALLVSTEDGGLEYGTDKTVSLERYSFADNFGLNIGDNATLADKLRKYNEKVAPQTNGAGPFVGYIKDAVTDSIDLYTKENGDYIMSIPYAIVEQFPATDRTDPAYTFGWMHMDFYCGSIGDFKWAAVCTNPALSVANNNICTSSDGGKSWTIGDSSALCSSQATGALFISEDVGFMTHEYREDFGPDLRRTTDGGKTWERVAIDIPESMSGYRMTPRAPVFNGDNGVCIIDGYDGVGNLLTGVSLVTSDSGMSWTLREDEISTEQYTLLSSDNFIRLYVRNDSTNGGDQSFKLTYTDNDGAEHSFDFSGSGYDIAPDSVYSPRIYTTDINGDYFYDIAVVFTTGSGTGVHSEELRLFAGGLDTEIPVASAVGYLDATLKITSGSNKWTLEHDEKLLVVGKSQFYDYTATDLFDKPKYNLNFSYHVSDKIYCDMLLCCAGPLTGYANEYLRVGYAYKDGSLGGADVCLRYAEGGTIDTTAEKMLDYTDTTGDTDHFILRLTDVGNALLEVTRDEYNTPFAVSFTAEGQTKKFASEIQLYGNFNVHVFEASGMTVFDKLYYGVGDTYVFYDGGIYEIHDEFSQADSTTYLYAENGKLRYHRQSTQFHQADLVQTGFDAIACAITSRDDYFSSSGRFSIYDNGNVESFEYDRQKISDVYDLDAEYAKLIKNYPNSYPDTLDEQIAKNSRTVPGDAPQALIAHLYNGYLPQGATEILYCGRISMNPYCICLFRTKPKSVCVYTIRDDYTQFNPVSVTIPDSYDYDSAEAIWAGGRGGSGESQFWVELEKNGAYTYLRYDNFAYTGDGDLLDYHFDGEVPEDELIGVYEVYSAPIRYPNTNTPSVSAADTDVAITKFTDESWAKLNYDGIISEQCREFFYNFVSGKSDIPEYNALGITDWKITRKDELLHSSPSFVFEFTVTGVSLDALPPGHYVKYINDIRWTIMYDDVNTPTAQEQNTDNKYAQMVYGYLGSAFIWDCCDFGKWNGDVPFNYIISQGSDTYYMPFDDFLVDAKRLFGIKAVDEEKLGGLIYEDGGIKMAQTGGVGGGFFANIPEVNEVGGNYEVIVQLYADINGILPSHRLKYTLGKDGEFLKFEIHEASPYEPEGLMRYYTKKNITEQVRPFWRICSVL